MKRFLKFISLIIIYVSCNNKDRGKASEAQTLMFQIVLKLPQMPWVIQ